MSVWSLKLVSASERLIRKSICCALCRSTSLCATCVSQLPLKMIIMVITTFKGAFWGCWGFFSLLTLLQTVFSMHAFKAKAQLNADHVHWVFIKGNSSCATQNKGTAQLIILTELKLQLCLKLSLNRDLNPCSNSDTDGRYMLGKQMC